MRYRKLDANGDMIAGHGGSDFFVNSPAAVAQAIQTRLRLFVGEWFLDTTDGTDWRARVLGNGTATTYDATIRSRILGTQGVNGIVSGSYASKVVGRRLSVACTVDTVYGRVPVAVTV